MTEPTRYASKAKVVHAIAMARLAGIDRIGAIELGRDGMIRITSGSSAPSGTHSVEEEIAQWRAKRRDRSQPDEIRRLVDKRLEADK